MKLFPVTVSVKAADPATVLLGEIVAITGAGLLVVPPPPPEESDLLQELNNRKNRKNDSSLAGVMFGCLCRCEATNIENLLYR